LNNRQTCTDCRYFAPIDPTKGECHGATPMPKVTVDQQTNAFVHWPIIRPDDLACPAFHQAAVEFGGTGPSITVPAVE
jgi:hypothetical protein